MTPLALASAVIGITCIAPAMLPHPTPDKMLCHDSQVTRESELTIGIASLVLAGIASLFQV
jgi:hypothetical protein